MRESANLIDAVETIEIVVPLSPGEVEALLGEKCSLIPGPVGSDYFGSVGNGEFWMRLRRLRRRGLRPTIEGSYEAFGGGTRITAKVSMPWWARNVGRLAFLGSLIGGLGASAALYSQGHFWPAVGMAAWMPMVGVFASGFLVADAAAERGESAQALRHLFDSEHTTDLDREGTGEADATEDALARARRLRKMREK